MLRFACVLVIFDLHNSFGNLIQTNERKQQFFRYRQNDSSQIHNETMYFDKNSYDHQSQGTFGLKVKPIIEKQSNISKEANNLLDSSNQRKSNYSDNENSSIMGHVRGSLEKNFSQNVNGRNEIGLNNNKHSLKTQINLKFISLNNRRLRNKDNGKFMNFITTGHDVKKNDDLQTHQESQAFSDCCSVISNVLYVRDSGSNAVNNGHNYFKGPDYLPPIGKTTVIYEAPDYSPPTKRTYPMNKITKLPFSTMATPINSTTLTIIKRQYYIPNVNGRPANKQPVSSTHGSTNEPVYIPVTKGTTLPNELESNTEHDPTKAMLVPAENDGTIDEILPPRNVQAENRPSEGGVELKDNIPNNVTTLRAVDRVNERGDVPDEEYEEDEDGFTSVQPTMAILVEPEDQSTSTTQMLFTTLPNIATTTLKMTLVTDSSTTNKRISMRNFDNDRHLMEKSGFTTQINMKDATSFKGNEYLPPEDTTIKVPAFTTAPQLGPAPAMAMPVPPEREDPIPLSTTTTTAPIPDTSLMITSENRQQTKSDQPIITTPMPFTGSEYLPPFLKPEYFPSNRTTTEIVATPSSDAAPAMAMPIPSEPEDISIPTFSIYPPEVYSLPTPPNTSTDYFRVAAIPTTTNIKPTDTNFKDLEYLPPKTSPSPISSPEIAKLMPKEPCKNDPNNTPDIEPRFSQTSCGNIPKLTEPSFKEPPYLPPLVITRM